MNSKFMRRLFITLVVVASCLWGTVCRAVEVTFPNDFRTVLDMLDRYVEHRDEYFERAHAYIAEHRQKLLQSPPTDSLAAIYSRLGEAYRYNNIDSSLYYYDLASETAAQHGDRATATLMRGAWAGLLPVDGAVAEGTATFEKLDTRGLPQEMVGQLYSYGHRMYAWAEEFYRIDTVKARYHQQKIATARMMADLHVAESPDRYYYMAVLLIDQDRPSEAAALLEKVKKTYEPGHPFYSQIVMLLARARYMQAGGASDEVLRLYATAAISDIIAGRRESSALEAVGNIMHRRGDIDRAYRYLQASMTDAVRSGSRMRALQSAQVLPIITEAYTHTDQESRQRILTIFIILAIALVAIALLTLYLYRDRQREQHLKRQLTSTVTARDSYISNIMQMISLSIQRLEDFNRLAGRKIKTNQTRELLNMIESGKMLQEQTRQLHLLFDQSFLSTFPDFPARVNALLQPQWRLKAPDNQEDGLLAPEMRLLAFIRLGVNDGARLARFLGLSVNTVYAYRNRLRAHALDRDTFEASVMAIGTVS